MPADIHEMSKEDMAGSPSGGYIAVETEKAGNEILKWQLEFQRDIEDWKEHMRGKVRDPHTGEWKAEGVKLMNERGIRFVASIMYLHMNKNTILTDLTEDIILDTCSILCGFFNEHFLLKGRDYNMAKENMDLIITSIMDIFYFALLRAKDGGEREFIKGIFTSRRTEAAGGFQNDRGGFLRRFTGKGGN